MGEARPEKMKQVHPTRPEGAEAPSPGHSPWVNQQSTLRPVRAKALKANVKGTSFTTHEEDAFNKKT